jgi:glycosyltransferase involved in cell wall biosynthesis
MTTETKIDVSVICITYNHEKYISKCLESIISQDFDGAFEIIIHDDYSSDSTRVIIDSYKHRYPAIIRTVYSDHNKYSVGEEIIQPLIYAANGKYIVFCEGDDFFINISKIEYQYSYLESHPEAVAHVHSAIKFDETGIRKIGIKSPRYQKGIIDIDCAIKNIGHNYHLNAIMYHRNVLLKLPSFYYHSNVKDIPLSIHIALSGVVCYENIPLSAYRVGSNNSWSKKINQTKESFTKYYLNLIETLDMIDHDLLGKHKESIQDRKLHFEFWFRVRVYGFWPILKRKDLFRYFLSIRTREKIDVILYSFSMIFKGRMFK